MKLILIFIIFSLNSLKAQEEVVNLQDITTPQNEEKSKPPVSPTNKGTSDNFQFFKGQTTSIRNPFELRDPFKAETLRNKNGRKVRFGGVVEGTSFTNLPSITNVPIDKITITGVLIGKERRAMARVEGDTNMYVLKEGMTLGVDGAEIKAILPGGIVLVEKIRNIYDQDEYLETILTIAQE